MDTTTIAGFTLSPQQKRLWNLQNSSPYNSVAAARIQGVLDFAALQQAVQWISDCHEILRTTFHRKPGGIFPVQVVEESSLAVWREYDLTTQDAADRQAYWENLFDKERGIPNTQSGCSFRLSLVKFSHEEHVLLMALPSLCADTWTLETLVHEIGKAYVACVGKQSWSAEPLQYADLASWQNDLLTSDDDDAKAGCSYWSRRQTVHLKDVVLPRESDSTVAFPSTHQIPVALNADQSSAIMILCRQRGFSAAAFLLTCWQTLLQRRNGENDCIVGVHFDGRQYDELKGALGLFARALPVTGRLDAERSLVSSAIDAERTLQDHTRYQEYFTWDPLTPEDGLTDRPVYLPYGFCYEEASPAFSTPEIAFTLLRKASRIERADLLLHGRHDSQGIDLEIQYDPRRYPHTEIHRLAQQFLTLVQSAIAQPDAPLNTLNLLPAAQREQLLNQWNQTHQDFPPVGVHTLFEQHARNTPDAPALACEGATLTYRQLDRRANQLAHLLRQKGVAHGSLVGICLERSHEMIVGLLAILKAGAAYVPLDPAYPQDRLSFVLHDSQVQLVLTQNSLAERLRGYAGASVHIENLEALLAQQPATPLEAEVSGSDLAYVIYTSGSTGMPKGVLIEHGGLSNYVQALLPRLGLPPGSRFASVSTLAADLGNTVVFGALCSGGCLHVISAERATDAAALGAYFAQEKIDCLKIVPSHLSALLSAGSAAVLPRSVLVLGGEACSWALVDRVHGLSSTVRIVNHYGPTETTVGVLTYAVEREEAQRAGGSVPLGRPLGNTQMYVLDAPGHPVPIGVVGELYVGGSQVARGYLHRAELTSERFCEHSSVAGSSRLYRTGDLVFYREDGNLVFVGRGDDQIKIRGYRVELGEIESALRGHAGVREAVVLGVESGESAGGLVSEKRLVGYVVGRERVGSGGVSASELRAYLGDLVPEYMIPSGFVWLEQLPLSPNGKIDRQALLKLGMGETGGAVPTYVPPRTPVEEVLCETWAEVLGLERVGIQDDFFAIGGHSLLATQVVSRIRTALDLEMPLGLLFAATTVERLAEALLQDPNTRQTIETTAQVSLMLSRLSDDEVAAMLDAKSV